MIDSKHLEKIKELKKVLENDEQILEMTQDYLLITTRSAAVAIDMLIQELEGSV